MGELTELVDELDRHETDLIMDYGATEANVDIYHDSVSVSLTFAGFSAFVDVVDQLSHVALELDEKPNVENINVHVSADGVWRGDKEEHDERPGGIVEYEVPR